MSACRLHVQRATSRDRGFGLLTDTDRQTGMEQCNGRRDSFPTVFCELTSSRHKQTSGGRTRRSRSAPWRASARRSRAARSDRATRPSGLLASCCSLLLVDVSSSPAGESGAGLDWPMLLCACDDRVLPARTCGVALCNAVLNGDHVQRSQLVAAGCLVVGNSLFDITVRRVYHTRQRERERQGILGSPRPVSIYLQLC